MKAWKDGLQDISRIATKEKFNNFKKRYEVFPYWLNFSSCTPLLDKNGDNNDLILTLRITQTNINPNVANLSFSSGFHDWA